METRRTVRLAPWFDFTKRRKASGRYGLGDRSLRITASRRFAAPQLDGKRIKEPRGNFKTRHRGIRPMHQPAAIENPRAKIVQVGGLAASSRSQPRSSSASARPRRSRTVSTAKPTMASSRRRTKSRASFMRSRPSTPGGRYAARATIRNRAFQNRPASGQKWWRMPNAMLRPRSGD